MADKADIAGATVDHAPVMLGEVTAALREFTARFPTYVLIDGTVGEAGHARALCQTAQPVEFVGYDRDPLALERARAQLAALPHCTLVHGSYATAPDVVRRAWRMGRPAFLLLDLGIGSHQFASSARGFSYRAHSEELDLRFDVRAGVAAWQWLRDEPVATIAQAVRDWAELSQARAVAERLKDAATRGARTVGEFVAALPQVLRLDNALARLFQALRIAVNDELGQLHRFLSGLQSVWAEETGAARCVVLSYHSLEDRAVKQAFRDWSSSCECPPKTPVCVCGKVALGRTVTRKPLVPTEAEIAANSRSRSARMRVFDAGVWA